MIRYFDASALVKRYVAERGSRAVAGWLASGDVATSRLSEVEVASALARRTREGDIAATDRDRALAGLQDDLGAVHIVELLPQVTTRARALLTEHRLRAGDAIQLASCQFLCDELDEPVPFVAFDRGVRAAARAAGLRLLPSRLAGGGSG